jgi:IS4 transposase
MIDARRGKFDVVVVWRFDRFARSDNKRARELCAGLQAGEIALFDKAYVDFSHLYDLSMRGVFWVTRAKDNMQYRVKKRLLKKPAGRILRDDLIVLTGAASREKYPQVLRRVRAIVEVDGQEREMEFLTNNLEWAPSSIAALYKSRWQIEVFFESST